MGSMCIFPCLTGAFNRKCHPSPSPWTWPTLYGAQEWGASLGVFCRPQGAVHPQVRTRHQIYHQQYSQLCFSKINIQSYLSFVGFFDLHCHLAFVTSSVSTTKCTGKKKEKTHPGPCIQLDYSSYMLGQGWQSECPAWFIFQILCGFQFLALPLATENKKPTFAPSGQVKSDLEPSRMST